LAAFQGYLILNRAGFTHFKVVGVCFLWKEEIFMSLLGFIVLLVIAAIAGTIGQAIAGYSAGGCLVSIIIGFIGAYLGMWLAGSLGLPELFTITVDGQPFPIIWSIVGSAILALLFGLLTRRRVY
jgi:uncharacterized membrane protein YeaQ/YmgE (transglycosylase-associated protein family)